MGRLDAQAAYAYWWGTDDGFADMGGYDQYDGDDAKDG